LGYSHLWKLPSGKLTWLWKITISNGKIHYEWPFSIATLNYQRVISPPFMETKNRSRCQPKGSPGSVDKVTCRVACSVCGVLNDGIGGHHGEKPAEEWKKQTTGVMVKNWLIMDNRL